MVCKVCGGVGLDTPKLQEKHAQYEQEAYELYTKQNLSCEELISTCVSVASYFHREAILRILRERGHEV